MASLQACTGSVFERRVDRSLQLLMETALSRGRIDKFHDRGCRFPGKELLPGNLGIKNLGIRGVILSEVSRSLIARDAVEGSAVCPQHPLFSEFQHASQP
jgi:hypothetical protein